VAASVCLIREVRGTVSRRIDQDWCGGEAEKLRKKEVEAQPSDVVRMRDNQPALGRSNEKGEESICVAPQHTDVARVPS
jgi:hypothetical protein